MNYSKIISYDICNGPGWRVTLFVSGCNRHCPGCFNPQTHDPCFGKKFTEETKKLIFNELDKDIIDGLSLLGGDPMYPDNRDEIISFCCEVKRKYPKKTIWMWTGYQLQELIDDPSSKEIIRYVDVIIDGPFIQELKDTNLKWKGSSNQLVWEIKNEGSGFNGDIYYAFSESVALPNMINMVRIVFPDPTKPPYLFNMYLNNPSLKTYDEFKTKVIVPISDNDVKKVMETENEH